MTTEATQGNESAATTSEGTESTVTPPETTDTGGDGAVDGGEGQQAYTPNTKFKFRDSNNSQIEKEFDAWVKEAIKNPETEKQARELYEKAHGLDFVKSERQQWRERYEDVAPKWEDMQKTLEQLGGFVRKKDYESFFEGLKIPEEDILKYAMQRIQLREMTPEQRQQYEAHRQERQRAYALETQNAELSQGWTNHAVAVRTNELDQTLSRPDVEQAVRAFEARVGQPGAFRTEVIRRGQYYHQNHGMDVTVEQAVNEVLALVGGMPQGSGQQAAPVQPVAPQTPVIQAPAKPPVIPNIQGRGSSPVKKGVRSIADLKARAAELDAQER